MTQCVTPQYWTVSVSLWLLCYFFINMIERKSQRTPIDGESHLDIVTELRSVDLRSGSLWFEFNVLLCFRFHLQFQIKPHLCLHIGKLPRRCVDMNMHEFESVWTCASESLLDLLFNGNSPHMLVSLHMTRVVMVSWAQILQQSINTVIWQIKASVMSEIKDRGGGLGWALWRSQRIFNLWPEEWPFLLLIRFGGTDWRTCRFLCVLWTKINALSSYKTLSYQPDHWSFEMCGQKKSLRHVENPVLSFHFLSWKNLMTLLELYILFV